MATGACERACVLAVEIAMQGELKIGRTRISNAVYNDHLI